MNKELQFYKENGLSFFPIPLGKKESNIAWKPYQGREPTEQEIKSWFENGHRHNIAVVTGFNNLVVLDCDSVDRFYELAAIICEKTEYNEIFDYTAITQTGRGIHIWLFVEDPVTSAKYPNLDIKSIGGYVIAPPSLHPSGMQYKFLNNVGIRKIRSLSEIGIDVKPKAEQESNNQPGWVSELLRGVGEGQRNDAAIKLAGYFRNILPIEVTTTILAQWNVRNTPPLPLNELNSTIKSAYHYPSTGYIRESLTYSPFSADLATQRNKSVTESVTSTSLAELIEEWVKDSSGWFSYEDIDREFNIKTANEKANRRNIIKRLKDEGIVEVHPKNNKLLRHVNVVVRIVDFKSAGKRTPFSIKYPFRLEGYYNTYPGNIIVLAGAADAGKTAFLLNFIRLNQFDFSIFYQTSEMGEAELASRLEKFEGISLDEWNFASEERSRDFTDVIRPDCVNIIDYMELAGDFYSIADYLRQIHDKLAGGIAIVALQKKRGAELGRGGDFGLEKPRLYLSMDKGKITIQKAKNWANPEDNPNGLVLNFKIVAGCKFIVTEDWHYPEGD